jgi:hypothetical protein
LPQNKIVNIDDYKKQKMIKEQLNELEKISRENYEYMSPEEQRGYDNFIRLLKALDEKYKK